MEDEEESDDDDEEDEEEQKFTRPPSYSESIPGPQDSPDGGRGRERR